MVYHQPDGTYFTEDYSHPPRTTQEYVKLSGVSRREALANELSNQARSLYLNDIVQHMHHMEVSNPKIQRSLTLPDVASMDIQHEIQWFMRPYLIDFLIEAHGAFRLLPETLFLTINLLDRYCSRRVVYKRHYQLVGCAALLIAAKYTDRKDLVPSIAELRKMCCKVYDEDMFTQMEWHVLNTLEWVIGHPTVDCFIRLSAENEVIGDVQVEHMAWYLCELACYHKVFVSKKPSIMAAASLSLARGILGRPELMESQSFEVRQTVFELSQNLENTSHILFKKYASSHLSHVSNIVDNFLREQEIINRHASQQVIQAETPSLEKQTQTAASYPETPQRQQYYSSMSHGYMTPPITPEGEYFISNNKNNHGQKLFCS
ncbi:G1/S-specific cyclin CCN1 [Erysiphe neolycopersici]|uniref:G1/S-specific cyclin CCN1 n=1 Tax=Erysiphe neolycopersici TaxID=212602 RepID=A0A420HU25_9PEZI|nr:G1/S-specific cyclin CCN1 [Erysiphe neolycopersici]